MSLTPRQRRQTAAELRANLRLSGLDEAQLGQKTGWTPERIAATLDVDGANPKDVWKLRDVLADCVVEAGRTAVPFSVLNESNRAAARGWFGVDR